MESNRSVQSVSRQMKPIAPARPCPLGGGQIQRTVALIANCNCPVLIVGEHGVGKRSAANRIHALSNVPSAAYTEIHCADVDAQTLISTFSTPGTVYFLETGDLNLDLQKLIVNTRLRSELPQTCRLIFGSSRELSEEVKTRRIREDFYYLISAVTLRLSPLRCRKSEILSIADDLLTQYSKQFDRPKPDLREEIITFLMEHHWPGNLPELQTAIKTFVAIGDQSVSLAAIKAGVSAVNSNGPRKPQSLKEATRTASLQIERQLISEVLTTTGGNRKRAANQLGISYKALLYKLKQVGAEYQPAADRNRVAL